MEWEVRTRDVSRRDVSRQKSTPSLDFIATPDPNSQQEFLTYPNSIGVGIAHLTFIFIRVYLCLSVAHHKKQ